MKYCWIAGWASDLSQWEKDLVQKWPGEHTFVDFADLFSENWTQLPQIQSADCLIAWSLGALWILRHTELLPQNIPWFLHSPFLHFCDPTQGWPMRVVQRMEKQMQTQRDAVLTSFADNLGFTQSTDKNLWIKNTHKYSTEQLQQGLNWLQNDLATAQHLPEGSCIVYGEQDLIVKPALTQIAAQAFPSASIQVHQGGHWLIADWKLPV